MTVAPQRRFADDAWALIGAFQADGARPYHCHRLDDLRSRYEAGCRTNGLDPDPMAMLTDVDLGELGLRVYDPASRSGPRTPVVLFIHGGGWVMGGLETHDAVARRLATASALPVVSVDYRLAPEHPYPAALDDCHRALHWVRTASMPAGIDATSVVLAGDSAGGQLAATLALGGSGDLDPVPVIAQVLLYPVTDLAGEGGSYARVTLGLPLVADTMRWFIDQYVPRGIDRSSPELSPLRAPLTPDIPPAFIATVDHDPLADDGIRYAAALAAAGVGVRHEHLAGYAHGLVTSAGRLAEGARLLDRAGAFIAQMSRRPTGSES